MTHMMYAAFNSWWCQASYYPWRTSHSTTLECLKRAPVDAPPDGYMPLSWSVTFNN